MTLDDVKAFVEKQSWTFAKTMPQIPHWYVVRRDCVDEEFVGVVEFIRQHGEARKWGNRTFVYLDLGDHEYWTMGNPVDETTIINRAARKQK